MTEMTFNLEPTTEGLTFVPAKVTFGDFERIKAQALMLNDLLNQVEVDEENVKTAKRLVAGVREQVNRLDRERIDNKKRVLEQYTVFEGQVKEINAIVSEGEDLVRSKIRQLEEVERDRKRELVESMWDDHAGRYEFTEYFGYDYWFDEKFTNKSQSMNKLEEQLVQWLEAKRSDIMFIDSHQSREDLLVIYRENGGKLSEALLTLQDIEREKDELKGTKRVNVSVRPTEPMHKYIITLHTSVDAMKVIEFMGQNEIQYGYKIEEVN